MPSQSTHAREEEAARFCREILPSVSRTFGLSIRVLPGELGRAVLCAYLICRIADTIEDDSALGAREKAALLDAVLECLEGEAGRADAAAPAAARLGAVGGQPAHVVLVRNADLVFEYFFAQPERARRHVCRWAREMIQGMRKFVLAYPKGIRIQTLDEYREYCYYVAGTVGYMLTDLWREYSPSIGAPQHRSLRERCHAFAEALQTVNILKDVLRDAGKENSIYVPEELLRRHGTSHAALLQPHPAGGEHAALGSRVEQRDALSALALLAWNDLEKAREYLLLIPRRAVAIRVFCALPLLFACATLRDLARSSANPAQPGVVKISRAEVKVLTLLGVAGILSNRALDWLARRASGGEAVIRVWAGARRMREHSGASPAA